MWGLKTLEQRLGYRFRDTEWLRLALTHPSVAQNQKGPVQHNQRLEFLGDAVLQLALTWELYRKFPDVGEGPLTKARAHLVNQSSLAAQARDLGLGEHLILSRGEEQSGGRERDSALADAFEAVLGAVFLDAGYEEAQTLIHRQFQKAVEGLEMVPSGQNPKGELQELLQSRSSEEIEYHLLAVTGPDHDREFECTVSHGGRELGRGKGKSKKAAETQAALAALSRVREQDHSPLESA